MARCGASSACRAPSWTLAPLHALATRAAGWRCAWGANVAALAWLLEGKRNDEIGALLGMSGLTVKNHLQRIYKLLGVRNRSEAVARCTAP